MIFTLLGLLGAKMISLREPYVPPIRLQLASTIVAGPIDFISRLFTSPSPFLVATPPSAKANLPSAPVKAKLPPAPVKTERGVPAWYTQANNVLDSTMNGVVNEVARHTYDLNAEDAFYLDRLVEKLRAWDKNLLMRADAIRPEKKFG